MTTSDAVSDLVARALATIERPYPDDVTDRVCQAIEQNPIWLAIYDDLVAESSPGVVNSAIGRRDAQAQRTWSLSAFTAATSTLIKTYTELGRGPRSE